MDHFDTIIRGGQVIDGSGKPRFPSDIGIAGERIAAVGDLGAAAGEREIDAGGLAVAPGFIDTHTHDDRALLSGPTMAAKVSQGVTAVIVGPYRIGIYETNMPGWPIARVAFFRKDVPNQEGEWTFCADTEFALPPESKPESVCVRCGNPVIGGGRCAECLELHRER